MHKPNDNFLRRFSLQGNLVANLTEKKIMGEPFSILYIKGKITIPYILLWQYFIS